MKSLNKIGILIIIYKTISSCIKKNLVKNGEFNKLPTGFTDVVEHWFTNNVEVGGAYAYNNNFPNDGSSVIEMDNSINTLMYQILIIDEGTYSL